MSDRTTICGISDLYLLAKVKDSEFNLSSFVRKALEHYLFEEELPDPRQEAARKAADSILREKRKQKKIVEESLSYEEKARELVQSRKRIFDKEAHGFFRNPSIFETKLPEYDIYGDFLNTWRGISDKLSERCGFSVTVEECMNYVRASAEGFEQ